MSMPSSEAARSIGRWSKTSSSTRRTSFLRPFATCTIDPPFLHPPKLYRLRRLSSSFPGRNPGGGEPANFPREAEDLGEAPGFQDRRRIPGEPRKSPYGDLVAFPAEATTTVTKDDP